MSIFPTDPTERKRTPIFSGCIAYFPRALAAVSQLSHQGNEQHNPGKELHWDRSKSGDEPDAFLRHYIEAKIEGGTGALVACAWRVLADLEKVLEGGEGEKPVSRFVEPKPSKRDVKGDIREYDGGYFECVGRGGNKLVKKAREKGWNLWAMDEGCFADSWSGSLTSIIYYRKITPEEAGQK